MARRRRTLAGSALTAGLLLLAGCGGQPTHTAHRPGFVPVGFGPVGVAADPDGGVWVVSARADRLAHIAAAGARPDRTVAVPGVPLRVAVADGAVWVTAFEAGRVLRVDAATGKVTDSVRVGAGAEGVTVAFGAVWVVAQDDGRLVRVDPRTRRVTRRIDVGAGVRLVRAGGGALWLDDFPDDRLVRVDPVTGVVRRTPPVCSGPQDLLPDADRVWVTCSTGEEVVEVDARTLRRVARHPLPGTPDAIAAGPGGTVDVVLQDGPTLVTLDRATGRKQTTHRLGEQQQLFDQANLGLAVAGGRVWVSSFKEGRVYRVTG